MLEITASCDKCKSITTVTVAPGNDLPKKTLEELKEEIENGFKEPCPLCEQGTLIAIAQSVPYKKNQEKLDNIKIAIELAAEWCEDQDNEMTDGQICIAAVKSISAVINKE